MKPRIYATPAVKGLNTQLTMHYVTMTNHLNACIVSLTLHLYVFTVHVYVAVYDRFGARTQVCSFKLVVKPTRSDDVSQEEIL